MKITRILGWVALGLVAGAAVVHCGGDDSNSTPASGSGQGGSHAGSSGSNGTSGSSSGNAGAGGGASGAGGANQNAGGMAGTANTGGGAGTSGAGGTAGAGGGDSSTGDARDSSSTADATESGTATDAPANPADSGTDVISNDATSINDSAAAADGDGGLCPVAKPVDGDSCSAIGNCQYSASNCFCGPGMFNDGGLRWRCFGPDAGATVDAANACPATRPEGGLSCAEPGQLCAYGGTTRCFCLGQGWFCYSF